MPPGIGAAAKADTGSWSDQRLITCCLRGEEWAWAALVEKYKNLIYSIPIRYRFSQDDAGEIFQSVCSTLVFELPRLRDHSTLPAWLIRVTHNQCIRQRRDTNRFVPQEVAEQPIPEEQIPDRLVEQLEREQKVREALRAIPARCQELVKKLFFEAPVRPYKIVAKELGLATGSMGLIRRRCLDQLQQLLAQKA